MARLGCADCSVSTLAAVADRVHHTLPATPLALGPEYRYAALPLAVADAIFSIGVRYEGTRRAVERFATALAIDPYVPDTTPWPATPDEQLTVRSVLQRLEMVPCGLRAERVYANRQRTCARPSAPRKAEVVDDALALLARLDIETFQDAQAALAAPVRAEALEHGWCALRGQASGISWRYFGMLVGATDLVKPDRMVVRFLAAILADLPAPPSGGDLLRPEGLTPDRAGRLLQAVAGRLASDYPSRAGLTARALDYAVWTYQRQRTTR